MARSLRSNRRRDEPVADGFELELASPPVVEPSVLDFALALDPPDELSLAELADEVALLPVVLPLVVDDALEPVPLTAAAPVELGDASALELPVVAVLLLLTVTEMLPPFALVMFIVDGVCVAVEPPCEPLPLCVGDTVEVLLPPDVVPDAVGELLMLTLPPVMLLVEDGDESRGGVAHWTSRRLGRRGRGRRSADRAAGRRCVRAGASA